MAYVRLKTQVAQDIQLDLAVDAFLLSSGAPLGLADVLTRYNRPTPSPDEPLLKPPGSTGGDGGGAKAAASEEATLASIERAANAAVARLAAGNFNPNHDKLGRFASSDDPGAGGAPSGQDAPKSRSTDDDQHLFYHPDEDALGLSHPLATGDGRCATGNGHG